MIKKLSLCVCLVILITIIGCDSANKNTLRCHVGGTMRPVMQKLANEYEEKTGQKIEVNSAGSGELLAHIEMQQEGDLYVCHDPFLDILMHKKLGLNGWTIAELTPVIIVQKGNPKKIKELKDLVLPDVNLALTDYKRSSLGRMLDTIFSKAGLKLDEIKKSKNIMINKSGSYVANLVSMKNADAAIVWQAVATLREKDTEYIPITQYLPIPYVDCITSATGKSYKLTPMRVTIATLKCSEKKDIAQEFANFLLSNESINIFKEYGFDRSNKDILRKEYADGVKIEK